MTRLASLLFAFVAAGFFPAVFAHGSLGRVVIDGQAYAGSDPGKDQGDSPIRTVSTISPVKGASNPDLNCGASAQTAAIDAPAMPGSNVTIQWVGGATDDSNWPHNTGPIMTYMASCGGSCTTFNGSDAKFFKVDQMGMNADNTSWYQGDIMQGDSYSFTIPENLAPGSYLIRNEIISLQLAGSQGGAEFYPACVQVKVGGSESGTPSSSDTVTFPGGYTDTEPGILTPDVYNPGFQYVFPGPPISNLPAGAQAIAAPVPSASFVSGSSVPSAAPSATGSGSASGAVPTGSVGAPSASSVPTVTASSGSGSCRLRPTPVASGNATLARRAHNRMRRLLRHSS